MTGLLASLVSDWLARSASRIVEVSGDGVATADIAAQSVRVAEALRSRGVEAHEPIQVTVANRASDIATLLGVWLAGAVAVPIHSSASAMTREAIGRATGARFRLDGLSIHDLGGEPPRPRDLLIHAALVLFTSGSTGVPKGVVIGHEALAGKLAALDRLLALRKHDVLVLTLQMTFIFGIWASLLAIRSGARLILVPKFSAELVAPLLRQDATVLAAVPSMLRVLLANPAGSKAPPLRMVLTGGEALGGPLGERLRREWPDAGVFDLYGSTETGSCDFCLRPGDTGLTPSIGHPAEDVSFRIVREDGSLAPQGEPGELHIRTPYGMLGYLDNPGLTEASFVEGYFRSGDLVRLLADGRTELVGRCKEIISRGGNKIAPLEIENLLCSHEKIAGALCAGVPDSRYGEALHAIVVLKPDAALNALELKHWAAEHIERFKVPDVIVFRDSLPVGETGKVRRASVGDITAAEVGAAAIHKV